MSGYLSKKQIAKLSVRVLRGVMIGSCVLSSRNDNWGKTLAGRKARDHCASLLTCHTLYSILFSSVAAYATKVVEEGDLDFPIWNSRERRQAAFASEKTAGNMTTFQVEVNDKQLVDVMAYRYLPWRVIKQKWNDMRWDDTIVRWRFTSKEAKLVEVDKQIGRFITFLI